jgi:hypothetical protein
MQVNFEQLIAPIIQTGAETIEFRAIPAKKGKGEGARCEARGYSMGEIIVSQVVEDEVEEFEIVVRKNMLAPIRDLTDVDLSVVNRDDALHLKVKAGAGDFELPGDSDVIPSEEEFDAAPLLEGDTLKMALAFLEPYHTRGGRPTTGGDHTCLYLHINQAGKLVLGATTSYTAAYVSGSALPDLPEDTRSVIQDGKAGFRMIPWELLSVGVPRSLSISREGAVILFDEEITVRAPWVDTNVSDWPVYVCPRDVDGWKAAVSREEFVSQFRRVAQYVPMAGRPIFPLLTTMKGRMAISLEGMKGAAKTTVKAPGGDGKTTNETPCLTIQLKGFGDQVGVVIPSVNEMIDHEQFAGLKKAEGAGSMLFWEDCAVGETTMEKNLCVVLTPPE